MQINTVTLGGKPCYDPPQPDRVNYFRMTNGASRPGRGEVLMLRSDFGALIADSTQAASTTLVMSDGATGQPGTSFAVTILGAVPYVTRVGSDRTGNMVKVSLADARYSNNK